MAEYSGGKEEIISVQIFGETYRLKSDDGQNHLKELAKMVDERMMDIAARKSGLTDVKIAVLAALEIADKYKKTKDDYDELMELLEEK